MPGGSYALVTPQNWLFLPTYERLRQRFLQEQTWNVVARLGEGGFQSSAAAGAFTALLVVTQCPPGAEHTFAGVEAAEPRTPQGKSLALQRGPMVRVVQCEQLRNRQAAISLAGTTAGSPLDGYARLYEGMKPGQTQRVTRMFWEIEDFERWFLLSSSPSGDAPYSGNAEVILDPARILDEGISEANSSGRDAWGKRGVIISKMRRLPAALYLGSIYDNNTFVIVPHDEDDLPALWAFVSSDTFSTSVRAINQKLDVALSSVGAVHFDRDHWRAVACARGALPEPASNDPTQWLFQGHPARSTAPLQVAVARLLGYRWPAQRDIPMIPARSSPER
ncbi:MAG: BREX-1 system adenine-specific DNA-methyltransferase PglX, partial [Anaerolinea sp.]|nr:BREX-1 system adenine-specific DNA-methyltransferase PglX [Anaerolinea sp.]